MAMQNILLLAFSIHVIKAVCRNLKFYLLLWESLFIIANVLSFKTKAHILVFIKFFLFFYFILMTKGHANLAFIVFVSGLLISNG